MGSTNPQMNPSPKMPFQQKPRRIPLCQNIKKTVENLIQDHFFGFLTEYMYAKPECFLDMGRGDQFYSSLCVSTFCFTTLKNGSTPSKR